ncbi:AraC family transcriptional regulator [Pseudomaricurvus alcaniphilus]|uniref:AraC family transcriptional regulator n=1 Tax=Pseudomaricurvus alcaniphilus TaxID=1166482 RepID=UPI00140BC3AF|nr:AraC family transcriptional regulator [Pseudomaricurvus alcaniphilus]NHN39514.1 AraC family transcriptional regulator [Pseudomaricurvus alcaniphilus]
MIDSRFTDDDKITSHWPLPAAGIRQITPQFIVSSLLQHPLSADLLPLAMGYYPRAEKHRMARRSHDSYLLMYCTGGAGTLHARSADYTVNSGDLILLPPGLAHSYRADRKQPWTIFWVHFVGPLSEAYVDFIKLERVVTPLGLQASLISSFEELLGIRRQGLALNSFIQAANHLRALLTDMAAAVSQRRLTLNPNLGMEQLLEHMQRHIAKDLDLEELAAMANLSKYHFIRRFKESTGHTPIQHFIHLKMERACALLDSSEAAIKTVAAELGYTDPLYFSRQFKKIIGISPQKYRELHAI